MSTYEVQPRRVTAEIGVWIFVLLDLSAFTVFFAVIAAYRSQHPAIFEAGQETLHVELAMANTVLLLVGSLAAAAAVHRERIGNRRSAANLLLAAAVTGLMFAGMKAVEYRDLVADDHTLNSDTFFNCYIGFTLVHLVHVLIGTTLLAVIGIAMRKRPWPSNTVESAAIYWHMVDLIWLILFPLLYLT